MRGADNIEKVVRADKSRDRAAAGGCDGGSRTRNCFYQHTLENPDKLSGSCPKVVRPQRRTNHTPFRGWLSGWLSGDEARGTVT